MTCPESRQASVARVVSTPRSLSKTYRRTAWQFRKPYYIDRIQRLDQNLRPTFQQPNRALERESKLRIPRGPRRPRQEEPLEVHRYRDRISKRCWLKDRRPRTIARQRSTPRRSSHDKPHRHHRLALGS